MSIVVSLFIFFFSLSLHACDARHLVVIDKDSTTVPFHFSAEVEEKVKLLDHLNSSIGGGTNIDGIADDKSHIGGATTQESSDLVKKLSGHVSIKPLVSVSWRVPVKKHDKGKTPGFFSDYSQPRTRAPSHN